MDVGRGMPVALSIAALGTGAFLLAQASAAPSGPRVNVRPRCFVQHGRRAPAPGRLLVAGFPPSVDLTVQFGRARPQHGAYFTDEAGAFSSRLSPGRLGRAVQTVHSVTVRGGGRT